MKKAIVLCADSGYLNQLTTMIKSIMAHHREIKFYILNEDLPREWFQSIRRQITVLDSEIVDVKIEAHKVKAFSLPMPHLHYSAFFRYFIGEYVEESRALYLDSDMIVTANFDELFERDLEGYPVGGVIDAGAGDMVTDLNGYFNSGCLLIDVAYWKRENIAQQLLELTAKYHETEFGDQGILNRLFAGNWLRLDETYNTMIGIDFILQSQPNHEWFQKDYRVLPKIIHYSTANKPWKQLRFNRYRKVWWFYYALTWEDILLRRYETLHFDQLMKKERYNAVVFTESGDFCHLLELIQALPKLNFHIAAPTLFWEGITNLEAYENVSVYPMASPFVKQELLDKMDCYLDINYGNEHDSIIDKVIALNKPIYAFSSTSHRGEARVFEDAEWQQMASAIADELLY